MCSSCIVFYWFTESNPTEFRPYNISFPNARGYLLRCRIVKTGSEEIATSTARHVVYLRRLLRDDQIDWKLYVNCVIGSSWRWWDFNRFRRDSF